MKKLIALLTAAVAAVTSALAVSVGDTVKWSNISDEGTLATDAWNACQYSLCLTPQEGLPNGSVVRIKSITFASWNNTFTMWDGTNKKSDIHWLKLNGVDSARVNGADTSTNYANVPMTETLSLCGETPKALKFEFVNACDIVVGEMYAQPPTTTSSQVGQGMTLRNQNGNANASNGVGYSSVRHINSIGVVGNSAADEGYSPATIVVAEVISIPSRPAQTFTYDVATQTWTPSAPTEEVVHGDAVAYTGEGTIVISDGSSITLPTTIGADVTLELNDGATISKSLITNNGTIRVNGGTTESPIVINEDGGADTGIGTIKVAEGSVVKIHATNGNKNYQIAGEGDGSAVVILTSGKGWGMTNGTKIRNCTLSIQGSSNFWFERENALDATVNLDIASGRQINLGNPGANFTIGALTGAGTFVKNNNNDHITLNIGEGKTCVSSANLAGIPVTIASGTLKSEIAGGFGNTPFTIEEGATLEFSNCGNDTLVNSGVITGAGTLRLGGTNYVKLPTDEAKLAGLAALGEIENNLSGTNGQLLLQAAQTFTIGSLSGTGGVRGDYTPNSARTLKIIQSKDTTWSGAVKGDSNVNRVINFEVDSENGSTLTMNGNYTDSNARTGVLTVDEGGAVVLTKVWPTAGFVVDGTLTIQHGTFQPVYSVKGSGTINWAGTSTFSVNAADGDDALILDGTTINQTAGTLSLRAPGNRTSDAAQDAIGYIKDATITSSSTLSCSGKIGVKGACSITKTAGSCSISTIELSEETATLTLTGVEMTVTSGVEGKVVKFDEATSTYSLGDNIVTVTIPAAPQHMTVSVDGAELAQDGTITVAPGTVFSVTYTPDEGYCGSPIILSELTASADMTFEGAPTEAPALGVAKVGTTLYSSYALAKAACTGTETIVIISDVDLAKFAKASENTNVAAIEIAEGVTVKGYFPDGGETLPLNINGTFWVRDGYTTDAAHPNYTAVVPVLSGNGVIKENITTSATPTVKIEDYTGWKGSFTETNNGKLTLKFSVAKSASAYYYSAEEAITAVEGGTEVTNISLTDADLGEKYTIDESGKIVLAKTATELFLEAIAAGETSIALTGDVTVPSKVVISGTVTLDLAGHKLTATAYGNDYLIVVNAGAKLTITDSVEGGIIEYLPYTNSGKTSSMIKVYGELVVEDGTLKSDYSVVKVDEDPTKGKFTLNGGTLEVVEGYDGLTYTAMVWGDAILNDGTLKGKVQVLASEKNNVSKFGTVTVNGGSYDPDFITLIAHNAEYFPIAKIASSITNLTVVPGTAKGYLAVADIEVVDGTAEEGYVVKTLAIKSTDLPGADEVPAADKDAYNEWAAENGVTESTTTDTKVLATAYAMNVTLTAEQKEAGITIEEAAQKAVEDEVPSIDMAELVDGDLEAAVAAIQAKYGDKVTVELVEAEELTSTETSKFYKLSITIKTTPTDN